MADYRPVAPQANTTVAPQAPAGQVNTGNSFPVQRARQDQAQQAAAPKLQEGMPAMTTADALRMATNMNGLPRENTTVAGMNQAKATGPQTEMQAGFSEQAKSNMGGPMGSPQDYRGLLQRFAYQLPGYGQSGG